MEHGSVSDNTQATFSLSDEDHTLANAIRFSLNQESVLFFISLSIFFFFFVCVCVCVCGYADRWLFELYFISIPAHVSQNLYFMNIVVHLAQLVKSLIIKKLGSNPVYTKTKPFGVFTWWIVIYACQMD